MIKQGLHVFHDKRVLLLQGPVGPFFRRLALDLTRSGAQVFKVNFNGGDWLFSPADAFNFRGRMEEWPDYFETLLDHLKIDSVMLFGDCRPVHRAAHEVAHRRGLEIGVFEEGYIRPDYVTLERFGVNGHSLLSRNPIFYLNRKSPEVEPPLRVGNAFRWAVLWAMLYYFAAGLLKPLFRHYTHHRPLSWLEGLPWLRSLWRKKYFAVKERGLAARLAGPLAKRFFLVPLQVHSDAQIQVHSEYDSVAHFIRKVVASFASYAPSQTVLVIKHHPMDRGYFDYTRLIRRLAARHGVQGRCLFIHDQQLPTLLRCARGVVVVNSTVGLSAIFHRAPTKVCGEAMYDMQGLTFQGSLDKFWRAAPSSRPNRRLFENFRRYLVQHSQLNGNFYKRLPNSAPATGMRWTEKKAPRQMEPTPEAAVAMHPAQVLLQTGLAVGETSRNFHK
jgi:capsular polysaccharide export protein